MSMPAPPALPAVASDAIAEVVGGAPRPVRVLAAFRAAVYLAHDDGVVALVSADGIRLPNAIVDIRRAAATPFVGTRAHQRGWIGDGLLVLPRQHVRVTRWFDPVPRLCPVVPTALRTAAAAARDHVVATAGPVAADLAEPTRDLAEALARDAGDDRTMAIARRLLGRGPGLTPAGDDVLAGLVAAVPVLARALPDGVVPTDLVVRVRRLADGLALDARDLTTAVSAGLLRHAAHGAVAAPAGQVLHALAGRGRVTTALDALLAVGHTSGRGLAAGLIAGTELVLHTTVPTPVTDPRT